MFDTIFFFSIYIFSNTHTHIHKTSYQEIYLSQQNFQFERFPQHKSLFQHMVILPSADLK